MRTAPHFPLDRDQQNHNTVREKQMPHPQDTPHVVFLDRDTLSPETHLREIAFPHSLEVHAQTAPDEVAERIRDAEIVITNKAPLDREAILGAPKLRFIAVAATGTNIVDLKACAERGIIVSNIRNYAINTVPEHTFALIFALRRSIVAYREAVIQGRWQEAGQFCFFDYPIRDLAGSTLGIMGDGVLGRAVADIGRALGMRILFSTYKGTEGMGPLYTPFDEVIRTSDIITLHCPLMPSTQNMISHREFAMMERSPAAHQHGAWRAGGRGGPGRGAGNRADRRGRLRCRHERAAACGSSLDEACREAELHPDATCRLGEPGGDPGAGGPAHRQRRGVPVRLAPELRRRVMSDPRSILHSLFAAAVASADPASGRPERSDLRRTVRPAVRRRDDGHGFFEALGDTVVIDPALSNVNDFRAVLIAPDTRWQTKPTPNGLNR